MALGGDMKIITAANEKLGRTYTFYPMAAQDNTLVLGGAVVDDNEDGVAGGGNEMVYTVTNKIGSLTVLCANDMAGRKDADNVKELAESGSETVFTCEFADGNNLQNCRNASRNGRNQHQCIYFRIESKW